MLFIMRRIIFISSFFFIVSCSESLEYDLKQAGDNRIELKKVLEYYNDEPLKYSAAQFLISNIHFHFFLQSEELREYYRLRDSISRLTEKGKRNTYIQDSLLRLLELPSVDNIRRIPDVTCLDADYLIRHIDRAFEAWKSPWARHLTFDEFCEYLLPYRVGREKPVDSYEAFRDSAYAMAKTVLDSCNYTRENLQHIAWDMYKGYNMSINYRSNYPGGHDPRDLITMKQGSCKEYAELGVHLFRSLGIPIAIDMVPQWANRSLGHEWNVFMTEKDSLLDYSFSARFDRIGKHLASRTEKSSKVFRITYSAQPGSPAMQRGKESVPRFFSTPCIKDVTDLYIKDCMDVTVRLTGFPFTRPKFVYLCTFDNQKWTAVQWAKTGWTNAIFQKMGRDVVYLPAYCEEGYMRPAGEAFILTKEGEKKNLKPDTTKRQTVILTRKYTDNWLLWRFGQRMQQSRFQVANKKNFSDSLDIHIIVETPLIRFNTVSVDLDRPYRYFRFISTEENKGSDIAELAVFDKEGKQLTGNIIGHGHTPRGHELGKVFDNNVLTYYMCFKEEIGWAGYDFGKPVEIGSFRYLPRNDDNFIREGELYEFFYWDAGWISLGQQVGTATQELIYDNAPLNALFLLRNLTKGKEERIFTYEDGKQVWW